MDKPVITAHNQITLSPQQLIAAVKNDFNLDITEPEKVLNGYASQVYKTTLNGDTVFILINQKTEIFPVEIAGFKLFKEHGIPCPEVIAYQEKPATIGLPTLILSAAKGVAIGAANLSPEQEASAYEHLGKLLKKINDITIDGYGTLSVHGDTVKGKYSTWQESWESSIDHLNRNLQRIKENKLLTDEECNKVEAIHHEIASIEFGKASLLHDDIHYAHVFVTGDEVTGIIDLGRLQAGDPRRDIAMSLYFQTPHQRIAFKKGYGDLANDPYVMKYLLCIAINKISFRFKIDNEEGLKSAITVFKETLALLE